jgi:hypothetical protein
MLSAAAYRRVEQHTPARMLTGPVSAHLTLTRQLADRAGGNDRPLHAVVAETAGLAAWLHADLDEAEPARRYYRLAVTAARRSGHPLLPVYMQASLGQYAVGAGDPRPGLALIRDAAARLPRSAPPIARAWLDVLEGVALAFLGDRDGMRLLTRAEQRIEAAPDPAPVWPWLMRFDAPKIAAYRATAAARLELTRTAMSAYRVAAAISRSPKQEALATVAQAGVLASVGRLDEAVGASVRLCYRVLAASVNARNAAGATTSTGPSGSLLSRTATTPGRLSAISTQAPFPEERLLLRQRARVRSVAIPRSLHLS